MAWSKSLTTQLACLCSVLLGIAHGRPTQEAHQQASEYVNVQMLSRHIQRNKRSLEPEFPHNLAFQFKMTGGGHVALDLQRSALAQNELPVYAIKRGGLHLRSTEKKGNYATYQDPVGGAAVLVKCPDQRPEDFELLGEFRYQGNHYHIEPASSVHRGKRDDATSRSGNTRHVVRRQVDPHLDFNGDALVPPPDSDSLHSDTGMQNEQLVVLPGDQVVKNAYNLKLSERDNKGVPLEDSTSATPRVPSSGRARREVETLYVEYIVVADYKVFQRWKTLAHGDTETEKINNAYNAMVEYYEFIVNGIDLRFRTATGSGPAIRVLFTSLLVSTDETTSPWLQGNKLSETTVDDAGMMYDFAMWKNSVYDYLPEHDHIGLFTGFDIATSSSTNPIGMGYLDSVCQRSWAVSETEETYSAMTVHIAAHELGHNLGSRHDGSGNACSSSALYLMAPRLPFVYNPGARSDPWTFSHCSQSYIRAHVAGQSASCLQNQPSYMTGMDNEGTVPAGLTYTPDEQCNMTYGQDAVLCRCRLPGETRCEDRMFAFDRTPCGDKKWCRAGQCVYSEDAPTSHPTCPFGDDPSATCAMETSCEDTDIFRKDILCCGTCLHSSTTTSSTTSTTTSSTEPSTTQSATSSTTSTNISTSSMSTPEAEATPSSSTTIQVSTISTSQFSSTDRTLSTTVLISGSTSTLTLSSTLTTSSTSSTGDYESTSSSPESPTTSSEVTSVTGNSSSTSSVSTDSGSSTNATHTPTSLESTTSTSETTVSSVYTTTSVSSTDASTSSSSTPTDLTTPNSTSASVSVTAQPSTKSTPTSSNTSVTTASSSISSSPSLSTSALTSPISSLSTASVSSLSTQSMTSLSTSTFTPSIVSSTSATTSESTSPTTPESTSSTTSESTSSTTPESTSSTISEYTSPTISESTPPTTSESTSSATLESTSSTTPESTSSTTPESTSSTTSEYTSPTISESTPPTTSESTLSTTLESTSSNTPESTSSTTSESTSTDALPESQSSPVSTTAELTTNTTDSPYTTTPYQALPTDEPKPALTLKLQTLVSLFMAAAIVV